MTTSRQHGTSSRRRAEISLAECTLRKNESLHFHRQYGRPISLDEKLSERPACRAATVLHIDIRPYITEIDQWVGSESENVPYHWSWRSFFGPDSPMPI